MVGIIASAKSESISTILRSKVCKDLTFFRNLPTTEQIFDFLWESPESIAFVIIESDILDVQDLVASSRSRSDTRFFIVGSSDAKAEIQSENVIFVDRLDELKAWSEHAPEL